MNTATIQAGAADTYSALVGETTTVACFLFDQLIAPSPLKNESSLGFPPVFSASQAEQ